MILGVALLVAFVDLVPVLGIADDRAINDRGNRAIGDLTDDRGAGTPGTADIQRLPVTGLHDHAVANGDPARIAGLQAAAGERLRDHAPDIGKVVVEHIARTCCRIDVAVPGDDRQVRGLLDRPAAERIEITHNPGKDGDKGRDRDGGRRRFLVVADDADTRAADRELIGVAADHVLAAVAPLVDAAVAVHQVVVTDVTPALVNRVVVVDRADGHDRVLIGRRVRVVDDGVRDRLVFRGPDLAVRVEAVALVRAPGLPRHNGGRHPVIGRGRHDILLLRRVDVLRPWAIGRIDVGEREPIDDAGVAVLIDGPVPDVNLAIREDERREEAILPRRTAAILGVRGHADRVAPGLAIGADLDLDHRPGADAAVPVGTQGIEGVVSGPFLEVAGRRGSNRGGSIGCARREPASPGAACLLGGSHGRATSATATDSAGHADGGEPRGRLHDDAAGYRASRHERARLFMGMRMVPGLEGRGRAIVNGSVLSHVALLSPKCA